MVNELLINLVTGVLGQGKRTSRGNIAYDCPFCHKSKKLEVNFTVNSEEKNKWACWSCGNSGFTIKSLFRKTQQPADVYVELGKFVKNVFINNDGEEIKTQKVTLPEQFISFTKPTSSYKTYLKYLEDRNISLNDILKYNIGYCDGGKYHSRIIIPSYDKNGNLNYFTARTIEKNNPIKYINPDTTRDIVPFDLFINWDLPIIICEGPFDALAIKRNVIPLMGKNIQPELMKELVKSRVQKIYIALDSDAIKKSIKFCEMLMDMGKEVYLVELDGKDPSDLGFENFTHLIQKTQPLTQYKLMEVKLKLI